VRQGIGAFETLRVERGRPLLLARHLARLSAALAELSMPALPPADDIRALIDDVVSSAGGDRGEGVLRLIAADARLLVSVVPTPPAPLSVRLGLSRTIRRLSGAPTTRFKALAYLDNALLAREAAARGLFDVIALNERGLLADGGRCTLFLVIDGELLTPRSAEDGALPGIVRGVLIESGIAREAALSPADLARASAAVATNALIGITEVSAVEPSGEPADESAGAFATPSDCGPLLSLARAACAAADATP
jgi:branched-subunit amino acid aminotransferase/4-amino-4-deoxychorismate lyase